MAESKSNMKAKNLSSTSAKSRIHETPLNAESHLASTAAEAALFELIMAVGRFWATLERWNNEYLSLASTKGMTPADHLILQIIRLHDRPKTIVDIGRILNRDDTPNINYSIRKLTKLNLVEKQGTENLRGIRYYVTRKGKELTDHYSSLRKELVCKMLPADETWQEKSRSAVEAIADVETIYDRATQYIATHRDSPMHT